MHRFYADSRGIHDGFAHLAAEDAAHASRVLRMKSGDEAELLIDGRRFLAQMTDFAPEDVTVRILCELPSTEARLRVTLYQGLPKADKMDLIVQKAVELGVDSVVPVAMSRCVVKLDAKDAAKKQERWQKIAREAGKQSGRCSEMTVGALLPMKLLPQALAAHDASIVPWEDAHQVSLSAFHRGHPAVTSLGIVIGPEGGMSAEEVCALHQSGCQPVTLGPRILRTETAGLCAVSALMCLYGDME